MDFPTTSFLSSGITGHHPQQTGGLIGIWGCCAASGPGEPVRVYGIMDKGISI